MLELLLFSFFAYVVLSSGVFWLLLLGVVCCVLWIIPEFRTVVCMIVFLGIMFGLSL
jgi:hypothetical protein